MSTRRMVIKIQPKADQWEILVLGERIRQVFGRQRDAIERARIEAKARACDGLRTQIRLCGRNGRIRREWTYPRSSDPKRSKG